MKRHLTLLAAIAGTLCSASPANAQLITGRLVLQGRGTPVDGAEMALYNIADTVVSRGITDDGGAFALSVPAPGDYVIRASRIGLATVRADVSVGEKEIVEVELVTAERAIPLEPIEVIARRRIQRGTLDEFYDRMERMRKRGVGFFLEREDLEKLERRSLPQALAESAPGIWSRPSEGTIQIMGSGSEGLCEPDIYLDGFPVNTTGREVQGISPGSSGLYPFGDGGGGALRSGLSGIHVIDLEGVEVYRGQYERADDYWPSRCGVVFLWRKKDFGNPFSWGRLAMAGGLSAFLLLLLL